MITRQIAPSTARELEEFATSVLEGLSSSTQKWLSARYFYDAVGSALFEAITALPEYGLTRADAKLIGEHAMAMTSTQKAGALHVIELGSGSGAKTRPLLEAARAMAAPVRYTPIDVSATALDACAAALSVVEGVAITPENASYLPGLRRALAKRSARESVLVLFLGSTIGNFPPDDATQFLSDLRASLQPEDFLLLGADLVKPAARLLDAYDDPVGVTAAFNRNLLARINRELGGTFDLSCFEHEARWNETESRVEMHLRSMLPQRVYIGALDRKFSFGIGETIWTESSYKFTPERLRALARNSGFHVAQQWVEPEWGFAETLLAAG